MTGILLLCGAVTLGSLFYALYCRWQEKKILTNMNQMLHAAIRGTYREQDFDESLLSSVETQLAQYLSASVISAQNLRTEKDNIKTLIADISHQTKTPISNILLYTQLLEEQELPEASRTCVAALDGQAKKLQTLIETLVKLSRLETGIITLNPKKAPIQPMLTHLYETYQPKALEKGIALHLDQTEEIAAFDPKWTEEAVGNLLDNAIKYTPEGGMVQLHVIAYEMFCRVDVADTGIGIPEDEQAKIFARFYRSERVAESEGLGIGLYLARQIAAGQGGYIKVKSSTGNGATFSLYLPRKESGSEIFQNC